MVKPKLQPHKESQSGLKIDELIQSSRNEFGYVIKNYLYRYKSRLGQPRSKEGDSVYQKIAKKLVDAYLDGSLNASEIVFPAFAFEIMKHKK